MDELTKRSSRLELDGIPLLPRRELKDGREMMQPWSKKTMHICSRFVRRDEGERGSDLADDAEGEGRKGRSESLADHGEVRKMRAGNERSCEGEKEVSLSEQGDDFVQSHRLGLASPLAPRYDTTD